MYPRIFSKMSCKTCRTTILPRNEKKRVYGKHNIVQKERLNFQLSFQNKVFQLHPGQVIWVFKIFQVLLRHPVQFDEVESVGSVSSLQMAEHSSRTPDYFNFLVCMLIKQVVTYLCFADGSWVWLSITLENFMHSFTVMDEKASPYTSNLTVYKIFTSFPQLKRQMYILVRDIFEFKSDTANPFLICSSASACRCVLS